MAEHVTTGGRMTFSYQKGHSPKLSKEQEREIDEAYAQYYRRKKEEKRKKNIIIFVVILIILALIISGLLFWLK